MSGERNPRYSAAALVVDIVRLLHGRGIRASETYDQVGALLRSATELLTVLGVEPDTLPAPAVPAPSPALVAAATLMRAAGIEPNAIVAWPEAVPQ